MATNKLVPFANGVGANVISFERWQELTTTLNNGFSSGIASSEQFNRLLAQGASAGYVIGKVIVDGLNVDADPLDADALAANFWNALAFLPIAGGTMHGTITFQAVSGTDTKALIQGAMGASDAFRVQVVGDGSAELSTAGDGNEPIYIRQYSGAFETLARTLTLLDESGNTYAPGTVTATGGFVGNLTGRSTSSGTADVAIKAQQDRNGALIDETYSPILVGELKWYAGRSVPNGYLLCDGRAVSRTTYSRLFQAIGTIYGSGDGATTFNLPNGNGRTLQGGATSEVGTYRNAGLPPITHTHSGTTGSAGSHTHTRGSMEITGSFEGGDDSGYTKGAFYEIGNAGTTTGGGSNEKNIGFQASRTWTGSTSSNGSHTHSFTTGNNSGVNSIYGASSTVQPPAMIGMLIIKY